MKNRKLRWACMLLTICMLAEPMAVRAEQNTESTEIGTVQETEALGENGKQDDSENENVETESVKSDAQPGERTATIMVVSITGNELTYYEVEDEAETEAESQTEDETMTPPDGMPQGDGTMTPLDGMPQGDGTMTPPDGISQNDSDSTGMPENMPSGDFPKGGRSEQQDTKTVYLPVPVVVHTDTDEKRTFSILEAGDRLQVTIVTDEEGNETITEIWMLNE